MKALLTSQLFRKMLSIVVMCLLLSQTTMTLINLKRLENKYLHSFQFNARAVAIQFEELILDSLDWGGKIGEIGTQDVPRMDMLFSHPQFQTILTHLAVVDIDGRILSHTSHSDLPPHLSARTYQYIKSTDEIFSERNGASFDTFVPIWHEGLLQGYIWVGFAANRIDEVIQQDMWQMIAEDAALTLGFFLIFLLGFTIGIHKHVIHPIQCVVQKIQYIKESSDTSARLTVTTRDEIGFLATQFNQMMEGLEKAKVALQNMLLQHQKREQEEISMLHNIGTLIRSTQAVSTQICVALDGDDWRDVEAIAQQAKPLREVIHHNYLDTLSMGQQSVAVASSSPEVYRQYTRQHLANLACDIVHIAHKMPRMMEDWQSSPSIVGDSDTQNPFIENAKLRSENRHLKLLVSMNDATLAHQVLGKKRVLVVGWTAEVRMQLSRFLEITYFDSHTVPDAQSCLEILMADRFEPNLIIIDMALPGMNGLSLGKKLRTFSRSQYVPIVFFGQTSYWEGPSSEIPLSTFLLGQPDLKVLDTQLWQTLIFYHYTFEF